MGAAAGTETKGATVKAVKLAATSRVFFSLEDLAATRTRLPSQVNKVARDVSPQQQCTAIDIAPVCSVEAVVLSAQGNVFRTPTEFVRDGSYAASEGVDGRLLCYPCHTT